MANSAQARKRARQAEKRRRHNASRRSMVRTYIKKVQAAIDEQDADAANAALTTAIPIIDRMAAKGILHKNNVARRKSRMMTKLARLEESAAEV